MHTDRELDTVRRVGKVLQLERGNRKGGGRGGGGGSGTREGKYDEGCPVRNRGDGVEEAIHQEFEIAESREIVPTLLKDVSFIGAFNEDDCTKYRDRVKTDINLPRSKLTKRSFSI